jgi:hypothetical protein
MSDTVEHRLGAVFLAGKSGDSWCVKNVIGLLEKLRTLISGHCEDDYSDLPWFRGTSPCVSNGYDVGQDQPWQAQLIKIGTSLYCDEDVSGRLEHGFQKLVTLMITLSGDETLSDKLSVQQSKLLLLCAPFDDSLKDTQDDTPVNTVDVEPKPNRYRHTLRNSGRQRWNLK